MLLFRYTFTKHPFLRFLIIAWLKFILMYNCNILFEMLSWKWSHCFKILKSVFSDTIRFLNVYCSMGKGVWIIKFLLSIISVWVKRSLLSVDTSQIHQDQFQINIYFCSKYYKLLKCKYVQLCVHFTWCRDSPIYHNLLHENVKTGMKWRGNVSNAASLVQADLTCVLLWVDDTHARGRPFKRFQLHRISQPLELTTFSIMALCQLCMQATEVLKFCSRTMSSQNSGVMNHYTSIILVSAHLIFMLYPNKAIQNLNFEKCWRKSGNFEL